jgi:Lrp/AsnC family leucine-responsive transcriptional regulator
MDDIDCRIIACLKENARTKLSAIADTVSLSITATADRIRKLENTGIISGYTVLLDETKIGHDIIALIFVRIEHPRFNEEFCRQVKLHPEILECHYVTGDYDFILKVVTSGSAGIERLLTFVKSIKGVSLTRTLVVLSTVKSELSVTPVPAKAAGR